MIDALVAFGCGEVLGILILAGAAGAFAYCARRCWWSKKH